MKKIVLTAAFGLMALSTGASAWEGDRQREIDARERRQEHVIQHGVRSGEITRREYRQLESEQARIRSLERNALRDGHIDRHEASEIRRAQNNAAQHIRQERTDNERRYRWW